MIVSFDLNGILCLIIIPPIIIYLSKVSYSLADYTSRFIQNKYIRYIVKQNRDLFKENTKLHNELCEVLDKEVKEE